jgi:hypothetical protein
VAVVIFFTLVKEADLGGNEQGIDYVIEKQLASAVKKVFSIYGSGMQIASCRDPSLPGPSRRAAAASTP